ncbi:MAG: S1-like domain-containing RNA-binding protein [Bacteroidota bacterium]|nr:S1-like domain-containing RNA-binding protein [Bacteroidota bacterium]
MIEIGKNNVLKVLRHKSVGVYLGDNEGNDVLLPNKYVPENIEVDDEIDVFIYKDSEDRIVATTLEPKIKLNEFACLQVKEVNKFGAFLDWGLEKDLLLPFSEQNTRMQKDELIVVYLFLDEKTGRLAASTKIKKYCDNEKITVEINEKIELLVFEKTDLGVNVIINSLHIGLIYHNEIFKKIKVGEKLQGFVKNIREDNKIDVSIQKQGYENIEPNAKKILLELENNKGFLALNDKSDPIQIKSVLEMSKKTFKKSIGSLYKQKIIRIEKDGIYLL